MNKSIIKLSVLLLIGYFVIFPQPAQAVIPPDFIFNIGTQIAQFFSIIIIFCTAVFGAFFQFFKTRYSVIKHKWLFLTLSIVSIVVIAFVSSYYYAIYQQRVEYQTWLEETEQYNVPSTERIETDNNIDELPKIEDENDQLNIGGEKNQNIDTSLEKFVSTVAQNDDVEKFINEYYRNIATKNFERAYEMSKKSVDYPTFKNWYVNTTKITLDKLVRIDDLKSSIELTLFEGDQFTRYGVLMTLDLANNMPLRIKNSEVKILAQGEITDSTVTIDEHTISEEYNFFDENKNKNIVITNQEFKNITEGDQNNYIIVDARENIEFENGYFPDSVHIRFADLKAGQWIELSKDKLIYVICWSGIRGKEVAEFLRTKKIVASYLENGANGWVETGGQWIGNIKFGEQYTDARYQIVFDAAEVKTKVQAGVVLVDTREPYKFNQSHIAGSINLPVMYTPTIDLENAFNQIPPNSTVLTVCDGYVNCFDAKITGVELERRGHQFLGRYNRPWEY